MDGTRQIVDCDPSIFSIRSKTATEDRRSLLRLQNIVRSRAPYTYLEIGSYLGGTLLPHVLDDFCTQIIAIDTRPPMSSDIRGEKISYPDASTEAMLRGLREKAGDKATSKILTFDSDAATVARNGIPFKADFAFIDGEHTNEATFEDFISTLSMCKPDALIAFHDSNLITDAILNCESLLRHEGRTHQPYFLRDQVCAFAIGNMIDRASPVLELVALDRQAFLDEAREYLRDQIIWRASRTRRMIKAAGLLGPARAARDTLKNLQFPHLTRNGPTSRRLK